MSGQEPKHRATNSSSLRNNPYAQAKLTFVDLDEASSCSAGEAATSPVENKSKVRETSPDNKDPISLEEFLTDREVAKRYKVQKQTVWRWAKSSPSFPKPFKIVGTTRWSSHELDEYDRKAKEARR